MADRVGTEFIALKRRGLALKAADCSHAVAGADVVVTGRAIDVVSLLATQHHAAVDRKRKTVGRLAIYHAGLEPILLCGVIVRNHTFRQRPCRRAIGKEIAGLQRIISGLIRHLLRAGGKKENQEEHREDLRTPKACGVISQAYAFFAYA